MNLKIYGVWAFAPVCRYGLRYVPSTGGEFLINSDLVQVCDIITVGGVRGGHPERFRFGGDA